MLINEASKMNLDHINKPAMEILKDALLKYLTNIIEDLIDISRSNRNTSYITNRST